MNQIELDEIYINNLKKRLNNKIYKYDLYYEENEHDHCEYCMIEISKSYPDTIRGGYHTLGGCNWFCQNCFKKYKDKIGLLIYNETILNNRYKDLLDMFTKELYSYDSNIFNLNDFNRMIYFWRNIPLKAAFIRITPVIYDVQHKKILKKYDNKSVSLNEMNYQKFADVISCFNNDQEIIVDYNNLRGYKIICLLIQRL